MMGTVSDSRSMPGSAVDSGGGSWLDINTVCDMIYSCCLSRHLLKCHLLHVHTCWVYLKTSTPATCPRCSNCGSLDHMTDTLPSTLHYVYFVHILFFVQNCASLNPIKRKFFSWPPTDRTETFITECCFSFTRSRPTHGPF